MTTLTSCPACRGGRRRGFARDHRLTLVRCLDCHLVYSDPQPRERVREKYLHEYNLAEHFGQFTQRKRVLYERRLRHVPEPRPGANDVCDVGCGDGQFLDLMQTRGWRTFGIEMNPPAAERAVSRGAEVRVGLLEELDDLPWGRFPLVTSWDSLEHTPDPRAFAERLVRLVAPDGTLAISTLNLPSLAWMVFGMRWSMVVEDHFTYWDRRSLRSLFEGLGMTVVREEIFGLGRDFVQVVDRMLGRGSRPAAPSGGGAATAATKRRMGGWDVGRGVLLLEETLNVGIRIAGGGVGVFMVMRRR